MERYWGWSVGWFGDDGSNEWFIREPFNNLNERVYLKMFAFSLCMHVEKAVTIVLTQARTVHTPPCPLSVMGTGSGSGNVHVMLA